MSKQRPKYKIKNWSSYNKSLVQRGQLTLWVEEGLEEKWLARSLKGKRGCSPVYSDWAIELCLCLKNLYRFPYRAVEGLVNSLCHRLSLSVKSPCYTQLHRRSKTLSVPLKRINSSQGAIDIVADATGLKVYGEGEWKVRKYGAGKRRTWKKLHLVINPADHEIINWQLTDNTKSDDEVFPELIESTDQPIERAYGDGIFDRQVCYEACHKKGCLLITPPRKGAVLQNPSNKKAALVPRDTAIERIRALEKEGASPEEARRQWKKDSGYHTRSLAETAMFRFKTILGATLSSRLHPTQQTEVAIKINILNRLTSLGMPNSSLVLA